MQNRQKFFFILKVTKEYRKPQKQMREKKQKQKNVRVFK